MKKQASSWLVYQLFPTTYLSLLLTGLLFPAGLCLPAWWGWENGLLENLQVLILTVGLHPHQVLEEWAELPAYWSMVSIAAVAGFSKSAGFSVKPLKKRTVIRRL